MISIGNFEKRQLFKALKRFASKFEKYYFSKLLNSGYGVGNPKSYQDARLVDLRQKAPRLQPHVG